VVFIRDVCLVFVIDNLMHTRIKKIIMDSLPISQSRVSSDELFYTVVSFCDALKVDVDRSKFLLCLSELKLEQALCIFNNDVVATNYGFKIYNISYFD
jgi:hypothetical protein